MAIRNLKPAPITAFKGKNTAQNLTDSAVGTMLSATNVMVLADNQVRRAPGYTLVAALGLGPVHAIYDFQRSVDQQQFILAHVGTSIIAMLPDGRNLQILANAESATPFQFVCNGFIAYGSNGVNAYRFIDANRYPPAANPLFNPAVPFLALYSWGLTAPTTAPAISLSPGTLTLTYGRQYVRCYVFKYTDSLGIQRLSISAPSPLSAHSGPVANQVVTLSALSPDTVGADYQWIFATTDSPLNTSATYFFAAEIANTAGSWGDTLLDSQLDPTRLAPYDNNPAPPAPILTTFQNRVVAVNKDLMQLSGYAEITLGIPEEAWPVSLFFNVPGGARQATAVIALNQGSVLALSTLDFWYDYSGYDASTFTEADRIASPGAAGPLAVCSTPFGIAFLSTSKRLWLWKGPSNGDPTEISADIAQALLGTYGMEDLSAADLSKARLHWYSYGKRHFLAVFCRTSDAPDGNLNLIQLWNVSIKGSQSSGEYTGSSGFFNQIGGLYQTDRLPAVSLTGSGDVKLPAGPYIYMGDAAGNVYRFPDSFTDNGAEVAASFSTPWMLVAGEGKTRFYWVDLHVETTKALLDAGAPLTNYKVFAATAESPDTFGAITPVQLDLTLVPSPDGVAQGAIRANLQQIGNVAGDYKTSGTNVGKYLRIWVNLPSTIATGTGGEDEVILKMILWAKPMYQGLP